MTPRRVVVACFGEALIDFLATAHSAAAAPRQFVEQAGGAPANVAVGVAQLGGRARFIGMLGQDMFGEFLLAEFVRLGVDVAQIRRTAQARTALAFVSLDARGERSFSFYRPPSADLLFGVDDFALDAFDDVAVLHACSNSLTERGCAEATMAAMRRAGSAGALVSMDLNLRPALWPHGEDVRAAIQPALQRAHLVKLSAEELAFVAGDGDAQSAIDALLAANARVVVVTDGAAPIRWWTRAARGSAPTCVVSTIDTTAAGDAFVAGLLHALVREGVAVDGLAAAFENDTLRARLLGTAAAAGALATTRHGAFAAMPDTEEVRALLEATR